MSRKHWPFLLFGIYPIGLFLLAKSTLSLFKQIAILASLLVILVTVGMLTHFLNSISALIICLFLIAPYVMGKLSKFEILL